LAQAIFKTGHPSHVFCTSRRDKANVIAPIFEIRRVCDGAFPGVALFTQAQSPPLANNSGERLATA
jgi:hypothetical protein